MRGLSISKVAGSTSYLVLVLLAAPTRLGAAFPLVLSDAPATMVPDNGCLNTTDAQGGIAVQIPYPQPLLITDLDVAVEVTHPFRNDLHIAIAYQPDVGSTIGPVLLAKRHDSAGDNYFATFDSDAASICSDGATCGVVANCTGPAQPECRPDQSLDAFDFAVGPGTFTLTVCDAGPADVGTVDAWSLELRASASDVDGNGQIDALTDGLLFLRYLFGFRGNTLITGVVGSGCTRCTSGEIEAYLALD